MNFEVFGKKYKVMKEKDLDSDGAFYPDTKTIKVKTCIKGRNLTHTYLHEIFHAFVDRLNLESANLSPDLEEMIADNFPEVLLDNFEIKIKCKRRKAE